MYEHNNVNKQRSSCFLPSFFPQQDECETKGIMCVYMLNILATTPGSFVTGHDHKQLETTS